MFRHTLVGQIYLILSMAVLLKRFKRDFFLLTFSFKLWRYESGVKKFNKGSFQWPGVHSYLLENITSGPVCYN